ncbi:MAG: glycosyltransferase [Acidobacteriota bacterium]
MLTILFILVSLVILKGLAGVVEAVSYHRYIRSRLSHRLPPWTPPATVILPCKGLDHDLEKNLEALLSQDYPHYELVVVVASSDDEAVPVIERLLQCYPQHPAKLVVAGRSAGRGEKVHNLIQAVKHSDPASEVLVFTDSDSRVDPAWLRNLVSPLLQEGVGASTGYRWYLPDSHHPAGVLRSVWNASVATLLGNHRHNFAWGGSMALRREVYEQARVLDHWQNSLSDDYSLTQAVKKAGLRIHYEPRCLVASHGNCSWRELVEWTNRQILITRYYSPRLWKLALVSQTLFVSTWWWAVLHWVAEGGKIQGVEAGFLGMPLSQAAGSGLAVLIILFLGGVRGALRLRTIMLMRPRDKAALLRYAWGHVFLFPLSSTLTLCNLLVSAVTSEMVWRGVRYRLISDHELLVLGAPPDAPGSGDSCEHDAPNAGGPVGHSA